MEHLSNSNFELRLYELFVQSQCGPEDFHIMLSPGSYAISAGIPGNSAQTQVVRVNPGESMSLTFNLWPLSFDYLINSETLF